AADQEAAVAAAHIDDDGGPAAKESFPFERTALGQMLEGSPGPAVPVEDISRDRYAKLAFYVPALIHGSHFSGWVRIICEVAVSEAASFAQTGQSAKLAASPTSNRLAP